MAALPPQLTQRMQQYFAELMRQGKQIPQPGAPPPGATPGINPSAPSPYEKGAGGAPGGPGGMGTGLSPYNMPKAIPPYGNTDVPPGAGGLFGSGSTAPMNEERLTGVGTGGIPDRLPEPAMGPAQPPGEMGPEQPPGLAEPEVPPQAGEDPYQSIYADMTEEELAQMAGMGDLERQMILAEKMRDQENLEGRYVNKGRTYVADSPIAHAVRGYGIHKGKKDAKRIAGEQTAGRQTLLDLLRRKYGQEEEEEAAMPPGTISA